MSKIVTYLIQNQKLYKCIRSSECITLVPDLNLDMEELFLETITEINVNHFIYFKIYSNRIELVSISKKQKSENRVDTVLITSSEYEKLLLGLDFDYTK